MNVNELFSSLTETKKRKNSGEIIWWDYAIVVTLYVYNSEYDYQKEG